MCSLLYPFQWQYLYMPLLPSTYTSFLSTNLPYVVGTTRSICINVDVPGSVRLQATGSIADS